MSFRQKVQRVHQHGACVVASNPDSWFRDEPRGPGALDLQRRHAEDACAACPVHQECLTIALTNEAETGMCWGIWGGVCARDRQDALERAEQRQVSLSIDDLAVQLLCTTDLAETA